MPLVGEFIKYRLVIAVVSLCGKSEIHSNDRLRPF